MNEMNVNKIVNRFIDSANKLDEDIFYSFCPSLLDQKEEIEGKNFTWRCTASSGPAAIGGWFFPDIPKTADAKKLFTELLQAIQAEIIWLDVYKAYNMPYFWELLPVISHFRKPLAILFGFADIHSEADYEDFRVSVRMYCHVQFHELEKIKSMQRLWALQEILKQTRNGWSPQ